MIWGAFSFTGKMEFHVVQGCLTAAGYVVMLQQGSFLTKGLRLCVMSLSTGQLCVSQRPPDVGTFPRE